MYLLVNLGEVSLLWMWKTRDLFKKTRDTKGTFHAKRSTVKDRNGIDLTEAEDIKKRWQEYTEGLYKKDIHNPDNYDGVITHLEPDILEFEVKWVLGSITTNKASGGDVIPSSKMMLWKCCIQYASKSGNSAVAAGLEKVSFHSNPKGRRCQRMFKLPHSGTHLTH